MMAAPSSPASRDVARLQCKGCGSWMELCAFCERLVCSHAICHRCLRQDLVQSLSQPHPHGG